jgi:hypothetical protein
MSDQRSHKRLKQNSSISVSFESFVKINQKITFIVRACLPAGRGDKTVMKDYEKLRGQLQIEIEIFPPRNWGFFESKAQGQ